MIFGPALILPEYTSPTRFGHTRLAVAVCTAAVICGVSREMMRSTNRETSSPAPCPAPCPVPCNVVRDWKPFFWVETSLTELKFVRSVVRVLKLEVERPLLLLVKLDTSLLLTLLLL